MPDYQTVVNNLNVVRGNGLLEVANYTSGDPDWFSVGAIVGLSATENLTIAKEENDNADSTDRAAKQEVVVSFTQLELLNLDVWEIIRGDLDTIVVDSNETKIFSGNKTDLPEFMVRITTSNGDTPFYFTGYKSTLQKGFSFEYQKDDGEDPRIKNPMEVLCKTDSNRNGYVWEIKSDGFRG